MVAVARQVFLDTETTGLSPQNGHRVIEIGCIEVADRRFTGRSVHRYLNPERDVDPGAVAVHGLTRERLAREPLFSEVVEELLDFVAGAEILIHNASFDVGFLDAELFRLGRQPFPKGVASVVDTLVLARQKHPGKKNSLDALCERYAVSRAHRTLHGALLDAELLAHVYLAMTRGQDDLDMQWESDLDTQGPSRWPPAEALTVRYASAKEQKQHRAVLDKMASEQPPLWDRLVSE